MDHERFNNISAGIQSIVISIAVIVGGIWSAYTFKSLLSIEKAEAELTAAQKAIKGIPSLDVSLEIKQFRKLSGKKTGVLVEVKLQNTGSRYVTLDLTSDALSATELAVSDQGILYSLGKIIANYCPGVEMSGPYTGNVQGIPIGSTRIVPYYFETDRRGIYLIEFDSPMSKSLQKEIDREFAEFNHFYPAEEGIKWGASTIIKVD